MPTSQGSRGWPCLILDIIVLAYFPPPLVFMGRRYEQSLWGCLGGDTSPHSPLGLLNPFKASIGPWKQSPRASAYISFAI